MDCERVEPAVPVVQATVADVAVAGVAAVAAVVAAVVVAAVAAAVAAAAVVAVGEDAAADEGVAACFSSSVQECIAVADRQRCLFADPVTFVGTSEPPVV